MLEVEHPDSERAVHATSPPTATARARRLGERRVSAGGGGLRRDAAEEAAVLVTGGVPAHARGAPGDAVARAVVPEAPPAPAVLQRLFDDAANALDAESSEDGVGEATREALDAAAAAEPARRPRRSSALLERMLAWAERRCGQRGREVTAAARLGRGDTCRPGGRWSDERVIVFTEYRATQRYLQERLAARGIGGNRVELLDGTTTEDERERIKSQWQEPPADVPGAGAARDRRRI